MNDNTIKVSRMRNKLNKYLKEKNISNLRNMSIENYDDFILTNLKTSNRSSFYGSIKHLNQVISEEGIDVKFSSSKYVDRCVTIKETSILTIEEVKEICNSIINFNDKVVIYGLFCGIQGKQYSDLINIKVKDIADDYSYIMINGEKFICDDYMKRILRGCIKQREYYKTEIIGGSKSNESFEFNMSSEYLLKVMPTKRNGNGLNPMSYQNVQRKLIILNKTFKLHSGSNLTICGNSLIRSGVLHRIHQQYLKGMRITVAYVKDYLYSQGLRINYTEVYRQYANKYFGRNDMNNN